MDCRSLLEVNVDGRVDLLSEPKLPRYISGFFWLVLLLVILPLAFFPQPDLIPTESYIFFCCVWLGYNFAGAAFVGFKYRVVSINHITFYHADTPKTFWAAVLMFATFALILFLMPFTIDYIADYILSLYVG